MPENRDTGILTEAMFYILLALYEPCHGYGIMQKVEEMSNGRVSLRPGTLYGAINTLMEKGCIQPFGGYSPRKKMYQITEGGKAAVKRELARLEELLKNGQKVTQMPEK
ncbi:PadR family transcriptional regulator [Hominifimenecus sp. rT4P-3]|uniref:PadR family transcriptional regulator n=1 Tax=Hominifimenecus sp. rT4P-3 TaxID=3242979 RepID=UPI003DA4C3A1